MSQQADAAAEAATSDVSRGHAGADGQGERKSDRGGAPGDGDDTGGAYEAQSTGSGILSTLLDALLYPLRLLTGSDTPARVGPDASRKFIQDFRDRFAPGEDDIMPPFAESGWQSILTRSREEAKFAMFYLHSSLHTETDDFCRSALCNSAVVSLLQDSMLVWGGDVSQIEGAEVAGIFNACKYPFIGVCIQDFNRNTLVLERIEGATSAEMLHARLMAVVDRHTRITAETQARNAEEIERRRVRDEQDRQYEESRRRDEAKMQAEREAEEARKREEEARRREEEERETAEQLAAAVELSRELTRKQALERLRENLPNEPSSDTDTSLVTNLRVTLGDGAPVCRRFLSSTTIQQLRDWITVELDNRESDIRNFDICCRYPPRSFSDDSEAGSQTLEEAGLHPNATLLLRNNDA